MHYEGSRTTQEEALGISFKPVERKQLNALQRKLAILSKKLGAPEPELIVPARGFFKTAFNS